MWHWCVFCSASVKCFKGQVAETLKDSRGQRWCLDYHSSLRTETCGLGWEMELGHPEFYSALSSSTKYLHESNINKTWNPDNQVQSCFASCFSMLEWGACEFTVLRDHKTQNWSLVSDASQLRTFACNSWTHQTEKVRWDFAKHL